MKLNAERSLITLIGRRRRLPTSNPGSRLCSSLLRNKTQADPARTRRRKKRIPGCQKKMPKYYFHLSHSWTPWRKGLFFLFLSKCFQPFWPAENTFLSAYESPGSPHETTRRILRILSVYLLRPFQLEGSKNLKGEWKSITSVTVRQIQANQICGSRFGYLTVVLTSGNSVTYIVEPTSCQSEPGVCLKESPCPPMSPEFCSSFLLKSETGFS